MLPHGGSVVRRFGWQGEWVDTKIYDRVENTDISEVHCLPDTNDHLLSTRPASQIH